MKDLKKELKSEVLESEIETKLKKRLENLGCLVFKFVSPARLGVPDRLVITPSGACFFVELKRPGGKLRPMQLYWKEKIEKNNVPVAVVYSVEGIEALVRITGVDKVDI